MAIRKRNKKTSNRSDASAPKLPVASPATITAIAGGVNLNVAEGLILNPTDPSTPVTDLSLKNSAGTYSGSSLIATQVDQFNVTVKAAALLPGTFAGTLSLGPSMTGIRSARGGTLVIPSITFP